MTEAVVVISNHRNEHYSKSDVNGNARFSDFSSPSRNGFKDISFEEMQFSDGILPTPIKNFPKPVGQQSFSPKTPLYSGYEPKNLKKVAKGWIFPTPLKVYPSPVDRNQFSPKTLSHSFTEAQNSKKFSKSCIGRDPINDFPDLMTKQSFSPITPFPSITEPKNLKKFTKSRSVAIPIKLDSDFNAMLYSERWAGPTYSNSPPPSSLPIPKFSSRPNRTLSLDLPSSAPSFRFISLAKSAPASPSRDYDDPFSGEFRNGDESATQTLRRILNLDSENE